MKKKNCNGLVDALIKTGLTLGSWKRQLQLAMSSHKCEQSSDQKDDNWGKQKGRTTNQHTLMPMKLKRNGNSSCAELRQPLILALSTSFCQCRNTLMQGFLQTMIVKVMHICQCVIWIASSWLLFVCFSVHTMKIHINIFPSLSFVEKIGARNSTAPSSFSASNTITCVSSFSRKSAIQSSLQVYETFYLCRNIIVSTIFRVKYKEGSCWKPKCYLVNIAFIYPIFYLPTYLPKNGLCSN